ncbi:MAG: peptidyl-prolyl cis-trans isomerase [Xanthomonadales bacterium]|nr:peptidyl-prolyl cis-trans isomerase [Xanthomonadales bacterium]
MSIRSTVIAAAIAFVIGGAVGWSIAHRDEAPTTAAPERWVARIDDRYISADDFIEEMRRQGGERPGQFQTMEQKRQLLDDLVLRAALVKAADKAGMLNKPDMRRRLDQMVGNRYLQETLRKTQREVHVTDDEVKQYFEAHADEYTVPARKRVAMLKMSVAADAGEPAWKAALDRMAKARSDALKLDASVPHFGNLARELSDDPSSRYRGGVIGWIAEGNRERYSWDPVVLDATAKLETDGAFSQVLRGADGVYLLRLVDDEPRQARGLDVLASGIRQRIAQQRLSDTETTFRKSLMREVGVEVRESVLASIAPLSPPASDQTPQPPAMPKDQG